MLSEAGPLEASAAIVATRSCTNLSVAWRSAATGWGVSKPNLAVTAWRPSRAKAGQCPPRRGQSAHANIIGLSGWRHWVFLPVAHASVARTATARGAACRVLRAAATLTTAAVAAAVAALLTPLGAFAGRSRLNAAVDLAGDTALEVPTAGCGTPWAAGPRTAKPRGAIVIRAAPAAPSNAAAAVMRPLPLRLAAILLFAAI